jgi:hypothetical protein
MHNWEKCKLKDVFADIDAAIEKVRKRKRIAHLDETVSWIIHDEISRKFDAGAYKQVNDSLTKIDMKHRIITSLPRRENKMSNAGKINRDWFNECSVNGDHGDIEDLFSEIQNADCEIDSTLSVWVSGGHNGGAWLDQETINDICERIDNQ